MKEKVKSLRRNSKLSNHGLKQFYNKSWRQILFALSFNCFVLNRNEYFLVEVFSWYPEKSKPGHDYPGYQKKSRLPYWYPKKRETAATLVSQTSPVGDQPFVMKNLSKFAYTCWPRGKKAL